MQLNFLRDIDQTDRLRFWIVFLVACTVIALETVSFQTIVYVNDYLSAMQVISIALLGIAFGGLLSYFIGKFSLDETLGVLLVLFPFSVIASFPIIIKLNGSPMLMMVLLTIPYAIASIIISLMFNKLKPSLVYLFDLVGAGIGALIVVFMIPVLREEGSFFLLTGLGSIPILLHGRIRRTAGKGLVILAISYLLLIGSIALVVTHITVDPFNMVFNAVADKDVYPRKIFHWMNEGRYNLKYSRGSLVERIDIIKRKKNHRGRHQSCYNGRVVDGISNSKITRHGVLDNRFPTRLKLGQDPDTLLVGPSGQGLCKAVQTLGNGHIDAVEINAAIANLMTNQLYKASGYAYKGMDLSIADVRTFMATTSRKYDFITLLNTHRIWSMGHTGPPEYCHSLEAMHAYFDHLKPSGFAVFEERNINEQADLGIRRILRTAIKAMNERGIENPEKNIAIFELWHLCTKKNWDRGKCPRRELFTFMMFKPTPITDEEYNHLKEWATILGDRKPNSRGHYRGIEWRYLPQEPGNNYWTDTINAKSIYDVKGTDKRLHNLAIVTDDIPYPFDIFKSRIPQWEIFKNTAILSLLMAFLPAIVTFFARRKKDEKKTKTGSKASTNFLLVLYFAILGIAYLLIEIVLIQKFAVFLSSPVYTLVIVLGTMLLSSGIGGYYSSGISKKKALLSLLAVVVLSVLVFSIYGAILNGLMFLPFPIRVLAAVIVIAPLGFFMGVPFPYAMSLAKRELTERHAGLMFGINGALGAMASPLTLILSLTKGFNFTIMIGGLAYLVCLLLLALTKNTREEKLN